MPKSIGYNNNAAFEQNHESEHQHQHSQRAHDGDIALSGMVAGYGWSKELE